MVHLVQSTRHHLIVQQKQLGKPITATKAARQGVQKSLLESKAGDLTPLPARWFWQGCPGFWWAHSTDP